MKYSFNSERFREKRRAMMIKDCNGKEKRMSQAKFIELLNSHGCHIGRNTLSALENGEIPEQLTLHEILTFCEVLDCDLEYLLDTTNYSTKELQTVCEYTGLSESAAKALHNLSKETDYDDNNVIFFISKLFEHEEMSFLLKNLTAYIALTLKAFLLKKVKKHELLTIKYNDAPIMLSGCRDMLSVLTDKTSKDKSVIDELCKDNPFRTYVGYNPKDGSIGNYSTTFEKGASPKDHSDEIIPFDS